VKTFFTKNTSCLQFASLAFEIETIDRHFSFILFTFL